ncbi:hypothetical protein FRB94_002086 [Tulasnella sp. JGI-2019a]|nr:hypothetical protein FRB94_002086 [Tulasnella sp. JGI-2019a]
MAGERSPITCHILDASLGKPAAGVAVSLEVLPSEGGSFNQLAQGATDGDGRCSTLLSPSVRLGVGTYKMIFQTGVYFAGSNRETFYPVVEIIFHLASPDQHYHIPLLLSPWSYTTYRGS